ncbi:AsnC family transcriptional regulator [Tateyamaria omphalii]|uniref:Lrp/AsnC family transcriptional regulator n=1 Tax=Tateyamaria omphalii TaxID=299262 RepID=UPI001672918B|nr:Lrp/AsnC family transcriptional regulator [Tateyamaria omphalii]GGX38156.1 AsnC family transcriptional regulator [Tateyamaria omphalii]
MTRLDAKSLQILDLLQSDATLTSAEIAERVALSPTACQRRIKRMRDDGVILRDTVVVDPAELDGYMTLIVQASLVRGQSDIVGGFKKELREAPQVQQCYYVTGDYSFVIVIIVRNVPEYERFIQRMFLENPRVLRFQTSLVMGRVKMGLQVPINSVG